MVKASQKSLSGISEKALIFYVPPPAGGLGGLNSF